MNFKGIEKKEAGKFITRYDITYETVDNQKKVYEIISRKKNMETYEALHGDKPDAVVIIATNETGDKQLVSKTPTGYLVSDRFFAKWLLSTDQSSLSRTSPHRG